MNGETVIDNAPITRSCRHCTEPARWSVYRGRSWVSKCDAHLALTLRKLGLTKLTLNTTTTADARIDP